MAEIAVESLALPFRVDDPRNLPVFPVLEHLSFRLKLYRWLLGELFPSATGRLLDLGSGPGHFARIASRHGFAVTALDARPPWALSENVAAPEETASTGRPRVAATAHREYDFVQKDLRDVEDMSGFDVVACIGVLYHLPFADQKRLLVRSAGRALIVDTELYDATRIPAERAERFTPETAPGGYGGALCVERGKVHSSYGNARSFWFDEASILRFFADAGRSRVSVVEPAYHSAFGPRRWYVLHA